VTAPELRLDKGTPTRQSGLLESVIAASSGGLRRQASSPTVPAHPITDLEFSSTLNFLCADSTFAHAFAVALSYYCPLTKSVPGITPQTAGEIFGLNVFSRFRSRDGKTHDLWITPECEE